MSRRQSSPEIDALPGDAAGTRRTAVDDNVPAHIADPRRSSDDLADPLPPSPVSPSLVVDDDEPQPSISLLIVWLPFPVPIRCADVWTPLVRRPARARREAGPAHPFSRQPSYSNLNNPNWLEIHFWFLFQNLIGTNLPGQILQILYIWEACEKLYPTPLAPPQIFL